jgi:hypothetical protein
LASSMMGCPSGSYICLSQQILKSACTTHKKNSPRIKMDKDWNKIVAELSSGEDSDEHDTPNVASLTKHGSQLVHLAAQLVKEVPVEHKVAHDKALEAGKGTVPSEAIQMFQALMTDVPTSVTKQPPKE